MENALESTSQSCNEGFKKIYFIIAFEMPFLKRIKQNSYVPEKIMQKIIYELLDRVERIL